MQCPTVGCRMARIGFIALVCVWLETIHAFTGTRMYSYRIHTSTSTWICVVCEKGFSRTSAFLPAPLFLVRNLLDYHTNVHFARTILEVFSMVQRTLCTVLVLVLLHILIKFLFQYLLLKLETKIDAHSWWPKVHTRTITFTDVRIYIINQWFKHFTQCTK